MLLHVLALVLACCASCGGVGLPGNMNGGYAIANPNTAAAATFASSFSELHARHGGVEFFDVYSPPIRTKYAQVFWTMMDEVKLDSELVRRFDNKTMAVVGYEADQVIVAEGQQDRSVPITWAYNHVSGL